MTSYKDDWPGIAIFKAAYIATLPGNRPREALRAPSTYSMNPPTRRAAPVRRGRSVAYVRGPAYHRNGKRGSWTEYMVQTVLAHTDTSAAEAAHRSSGKFPEKSLDFSWMFKHQYITKGP